MERGEFVDGDGGQFTVGEFEQDRIAVNFVVEIAAVMHAVPAPFGANDGSARFRGPTSPTDRDGVLDLDPIARF
jgi:hypothetical protein